MICPLLLLVALSQPADARMQRHALVQEEPTPAGSWVLYAEDARCPAPVGPVTLPLGARVNCYRQAAWEYVRAQFVSAKQVPGPKGPCTYPSDSSWEPCMTSFFASRIPEIRFGLNAVWITGSISGVVTTGCAAGYADPRFLRISLAEKDRTLRLVAWETANWLLAWHLDRYASADGPIAADATSYAERACDIGLGD